MTIEEPSHLVLEVSRVLFVNGQSTRQTIMATERLAASIGLNAKLLPRWGQLQLQIESNNPAAAHLSAIAADPTGVAMNRVSAAMHLIDDVIAKRTTLTDAATAIATISKLPPSPTWLFALAAAAGAAALSVVFGVEHFHAGVLIFISAGAGAFLRRGLARVSTNPFLQPFAASLLAGIVGALAVRYRLSSSLRLVGVCPCMVLVPGPAVLNSGLDLIRGRIHLGAARLVFACLIIAAISAGLLLGLSLLGVSLPVDQVSNAVPLWQDTIAAGVAVGAYAIFFSMPLNMLAWPIAVGMCAHALRWYALSALHCGAPVGALLACLVVSAVLAPVAQRRHMPFAAVAFASVVSLIPGVYLFRTASGLVQLADMPHATFDLLIATLSDAITALYIIAAMTLGLILPKIVTDHLLPPRI
jgi:uncharacterized membrane protein YjjP (DUF1212 family)